MGIKKKALNKIRKDRQADLSENENKQDNNDDNIGDYSYNFEDSSLSGNDSDMIKDKDKADKAKEKKKIQHKQTNKEINQKNDDNSEIILDESELTMRDFLKYKIIFEVFKYQVNSGLYFSFFEVFHYVFCKCLSWGNKKKKFQTFDVALRLIDKDTDFVTLIRSVQDFDLIKKALLEKDQQNLFSSIARETITMSDMKSSTTENLANPKSFKEDKSDRSLINLNLTARTNLLKQQIDCLNSALKNLSNSDREDDDVDVKLINQLKVDNGLIGAIS